MAKLAVCRLGLKLRDQFTLDEVSAISVSFYMVDDCHNMSCNAASGLKEVLSETCFLGRDFEQNHRRAWCWWLWLLGQFRPNVIPLSTG